MNKNPSKENPPSPGQVARAKKRAPTQQRLLDAPDSQTDEPTIPSAADSEGWGAPPVSTGRHIPIPSGDDEDSEGRSDTERLVIDGVREAGDEQMRSARRPADNNP
jgi:hypothetical protein